VACPQRIITLLENADCGGADTAQLAETASELTSAELTLKAALLLS
jgi:hypothetical protein